MNENETGILESINSPDDLKKLSAPRLFQLCGEIRSYLCETVYETGGHLASNLGVVELTLALHYVFDVKKDKIIFDVGHQCYTHKILTGRREDIKNMRAFGGISGFPQTEESIFDAFGAGHSSTSISAAVGMARARDLLREQSAEDAKGKGGAEYDYNVIALIGDGAIGGGMAFEALNDIGALPSKMLVILNDNKMSISKNVGGISRHLARLRINPRYARLKVRVSRSIREIPFFGREADNLIRRGKSVLRGILLPNKFFEQLGMKYVGPVDGHNLPDLIDVLKGARDESQPLLLHVVTTKGKGSAEAECDPTKYHGVEGSNNGCGEEQIVADTVSSFSKAAGDALVAAAERDNRIITITAGMAEGTGLTAFRDKFPARFFDVGIAEQHAVTMAAGMAAAGMKPYFAVYSTFLQRAYDQILHDVCLQGLPVTFLIDRAGIAGPDGRTHQGIYDIAFLSSMPDMALCAPKDTAELLKMIEWSLRYNRPLAIRYPKSCNRQFCDANSAESGGETPIEYGKWEILSGGPAAETVIIPAGNRMLETAFDAVTQVTQGGRVTVLNNLANAAQISTVTPSPCAIINARFIIPPDYKMLDKIFASAKKIIVAEDGIESGGLYSAVLAYYNKYRNAESENGIYKSGHSNLQILPFSIKEKTVGHGSIEGTFRRLGLTAAGLAALIN